MKRLIASFLAAMLCVPVVPALASAHAPALSGVSVVEEATFGVDDAKALAQEIEQASSEQMAPDSLIVTLKDEDAGELSALSASDEAVPADAEIISADEEGAPVISMQLPDGASVSDTLDALAQSGDVKSVQPNYIYQLVDEVPGDVASPQEGFLDAFGTARLEVNDPYARNRTYSTNGVVNEWYLDSINATSGWTVSKCEGSVTVAVMDTGVNFEHNDLRGVLDKSNARQFYYSDYSRRSIVSAPYTISETSKEYAHGTHVAGIVSAQAGNGYQFAGVSYNAKVLPIKIFFDYVVDGKRKVVTNDALLIKAYEYIFSLVDAGRSDIKVINLSLGGDTVDDALEQVINRAKSQYNILTVCASGNSNTSKATYPSDFAACTSVTSVTNGDVKAPFSNYGAAKDIAAPGTYIWSTYTGSSDATYAQSGTSMSSPMVSACAALLWAYDPSLKVDEVQDLMYTTASPVSSATAYLGHGKLDVYGALSKLASGAKAPQDTMSGSVRRVSQGSDAADTAAAVSSATFSRATYAVLARNDDFADSMSATGLAGALDAPILLTTRGYLSPSTSAELRRLGVSTVYMIGGEAVLPAASIEPGLRAAGVTNIRRVFGSSASDTSLECAKMIASLNAQSSASMDKVIMATPTSFEDAISMSGFAYAYRVPILLQSEGASAHERSLSGAARSFLSNHCPTATIFVPGGVNAVSWESAEGTFGRSVVRLTEGSTAYDTSNYIANYMVGSGYLDAKTVTVACGATGAKGLDGLAGGALAGKAKGVVLLMNGNDALGPVDNTVVDGFIAKHSSQIVRVNAIGGKVVMPDVSLGYISGALA